MRKLRTKNLNYVLRFQHNMTISPLINIIWPHLIIFPRTLILKFSILLLCVSLWFIAVWVWLIDLKITYMQIEGTELGEFKDPNQRGTYYCRLTFEDVLLYIRPEYILSHLSHVWLLVTLLIVALQAPPSMGFSRQE